MKYKKSINCNKPRGFSQKQYCKYGRKQNDMKKNDMKQNDMKNNDMKKTIKNKNRLKLSS
jgi:hypothetical protein